MLATIILLVPVPRILPSKEPFVAIVGRSRNASHAVLLAAQTSLFRFPRLRLAFATIEGVARPTDRLATVGFLGTTPLCLPLVGILGAIVEFRCRRGAFLLMLATPILFVCRPLVAAGPAIELAASSARGLATPGTRMGIPLVFPIIIVFVAIYHPLQIGGVSCASHPAHGTAPGSLVGAPIRSVSFSPIIAIPISTTHTACRHAAEAPVLPVPCLPRLAFGYVAIVIKALRSWASATHVAAAILLFLWRPVFIPRIELEIAIERHTRLLFRLATPRPVVTGPIFPLASIAVALEGGLGLRRWASHAISLAAIRFLRC